MDIYATDEWTHHCTGTRDGLIREDFFYVFGEPGPIARLRVDVRPVDESPENTARLLPALQRALTARFGPGTHEPELMEIGFRHLRYGQPIVGDHWKGGGLHYFLPAAHLGAPLLAVGVQQPLRFVRVEQDGSGMPAVFDWQSVQIAQDAG